MDKVHVYMCLHIALIESTAGNKTTLFPSPFLISTTCFLILAEAFPNDQVATCSTALPSATEKNEMGSCVTVSCSTKTTQRSGTADWVKFWCPQQIGCDRTHKEQIVTFNVMLQLTFIKFSNLIDTVNLDLNYCTSQFKEVY